MNLCEEKESQLEAYPRLFCVRNRKIGVNVDNLVDYQLREQYPGMH